MPRQRPLEVLHKHLDRSGAAGKGFSERTAVMMERSKVIDTLAKGEAFPCAFPFAFAPILSKTDAFA